MNTRLKREKPSSRSFKRKSGTMFKLPNWGLCTYLLECCCPIPCSKDSGHSDSYAYVSYPITFSEIFHWAGVCNDFLETVRWGVYFKKIERTRNTKEKKNIGFLEMHNIFVAADEEKRKKIMKMQINNTKRKKNENSKKTG